MSDIMEDRQRNDDELTARRLRTLLIQRYPHLKISLSMMKRWRKQNGWICTRPHYCQLIRDQNKVKRKEWCQRQLGRGETFDDVIFTDECTVQLNHHGRKENEPRALKQRPKHPAKIHIWGGISKRGATCIVMFNGIMNAVRYGKIIEASLVSFVRTYFPDGHRLQQDNDPKHCSVGFSGFITSIGGKHHLNHQHPH